MWTHKEFETQRDWKVLYSFSHNFTSRVGINEFHALMDNKKSLRRKSHLGLSIVTSYKKEGEIVMQVARKKN